MDYVFLDIADSTMNYAATHQHDLGDRTMVVAHNQESGRGQRGNSWESEPGKNLTVTMLYRPAPDANPRPLDEQQFRISEAAALGVADTLKAYGLKAMVKWSNDVYVGDCKISGILIEHTIIGNRLDNSRIGIGLNVNQREFVSDAPNPVSMYQLLGEELPLARVLDTLSEKLERRLEQDADTLHADYMSRLWRRDGQYYGFRMREGERAEFQASIRDVRRNGPLVLLMADGAETAFYFKEVEFIL